MSAAAEQFTSTWKLFDTDNRGNITPQEFKLILRALSLCPSEKDLNSAIKPITDSSDNTISYSAGLQLYQEKHASWQPKPQELQRALKLFEKDGKVPMAEMRSVMCSMGEKMRDTDVDDLLKRVNVEEGMIRLDDLQRLLLGEK
mmetsp:Transcript_2315/g.8631  ORF Transcript_2315/g.8631 Transcript_2315/m.8631 type:complete len:144 (-) Transcript_2315:2710-3141(-)